MEEDEVAGRYVWMAKCDVCLIFKAVVLIFFLSISLVRGLGRLCVDGPAEDKP